MGKKIFILLVVALMGMLCVPALASATLVNEYGMHYAGQSTCLGCHSRYAPGNPLRVDSALHGRFAQAGILPAAPENWTSLPGRRRHHSGARYVPDQVHRRRHLQPDRPELDHPR